MIDTGHRRLPRRAAERGRPAGRETRLRPSRGPPARLVGEVSERVAKAFEARCIASASFRSVDKSADSAIRHHSGLYADQFPKTDNEGLARAAGEVRRSVITGARVLCSAIQDLTWS